MELIYLVDLLGVLVFTLSGALAASDKAAHHDVFSVFITGFITAIGGGTLRDVILGAYPVVWIKDIHYLYVIFLGVALMFLLRKWLLILSRTLRLFDTVGTAIYVILGVQKCLALDVNPLAAVILGMMSGIFGGVIRDTLLNEIPTIFRKELYATPCMAGAAIYLLLRKWGIEENVNFLFSIGFIVIFRLMAIRFHWSLPVLKFREPNN